MTAGDTLSAEARKDLLALAPGVFVQKWLLDRIPHIFGSDWDALIQWKATAARLLEVDTHAIAFVGSACAGVSLTPGRNLALFSPQSDVDVAVVSPLHFDLAWRWLRTLGPKYHSLPQGAQHWVKQHQERLVYFGAIATDQIIAHLPYAKRWLEAQQKLSELKVTQDRTVNFRVYRDSAALVDYQTYGVRQLRDELLSLGDGK